MHQLIRRRLAVAAVMACLLLAWGPGCRRSGPVVEMVQGMVTLDGQPIEGVTVAFTPIAAGVGLQAVGRSDANGRFRLNAARGGRPGAGTPVGEYAVTFLKTEGSNNPISVVKPDGTPRDDIEIEKEIQAQAVRPGALKHIVPQAYSDTKTSGLKATVKKGLNTGDAFRFDLKSDFKGAASGAK